ncbi:hypothetical protein XELAEV_18036762mg [Xenopus laevis]|uniref:Uncharacterized protein n=1 Tax=Xenopus laevis TaxID=8355 RepID=A0A974CBD4_XENLA|nr:hypothetical protein XELAEV_18036762mg [Xenopus laevis]
MNSCTIGSSLLDSCSVSIPVVSVLEESSTCAALRLLLGDAGSWRAGARCVNLDITVIKVVKSFVRLKQNRNKPYDLLICTCQTLPPQKM